MHKPLLLVLFCTKAVLALSTPVLAEARQTEMLIIPAGEYRALYSSQASPIEWVKVFQLDKTPVTNAQFYAFTQANPQWSKTEIKDVFAESNYLKHWLLQKGQFSPVEFDLQSPVTNISWFAAQAYCKAQNKRLPTIAEWEYVGQASETQANGSKEEGYNRRILDWYGKKAPTHLAHIQQGPPNYYGVFDMHGLIWEWTKDFNAAVSNKLKRSNPKEIQVDGRTISLDVGAFCGAGGEGVADASDYAAFMRYGFRSSLKAPFTLDSLGFRCAADVQP